MMSYSAKVANQMPIAFDAILDSKTQVLQMSYQAPHESILTLFYQAVGFILNM